MPKKLSKKQRVTLREIDKLSKSRKRDMILGSISIALMVILIIGYNTLTYNLGVVSPDNAPIRGMLYITAMVIAGYSGIMFMHASKKRRQIEGYRQSVGISRETLDAWNRGEYEEDA